MVVIKKSVEEYAADIKWDFSSNSDDINDVNTGSVIDVFSTSVATGIEDVQTYAEDLNNQCFIDTATGEYIDKLGSYVGINRIQGEKSKGIVTFLRNEPTTSNFSLPAGLVVSTQPTLDNGQISFVTLDDVVFSTTLPSEANYETGKIFYAPGQRFFNGLDNMSITRAGSPVTYTKDIEYKIDEGEINFIDNFDMLDDCTDGIWISGANTQDMNIETDEGITSENTFSLLKNNTTVDTISYSKTGSLVTSELQGAGFYIKIKDQSTLDKIKSLTVSLGTSVDDRAELTKPLKIGWNFLSATSESKDLSLYGTIDWTKLNYYYMKVVTNNITDIIAEKEIMFGGLLQGDLTPYHGKYINLAPTSFNNFPDNETNMEYTLIPTSVDVNVEATQIGINGNVASEKVIYKVSSIPEIDFISNYEGYKDGLDLESDEIYRARIVNTKNISDINNINSITSRVDSLSYVLGSSIIDTPKINVVDETFVYDTGVDTYTLKFESIQGGVTTVTSGATTYIENTDYELTSNNTLVWLVAGTKPTNGDNFLVDYEANKIGWFNLNVIGITGTLSPVQLTGVKEVVDTVKSLGVYYNVVEPTYISVVVSCNIDVNENYLASVVRDSLIAGINTYIGSLKLGENVLLAEIYKIGMSTDGLDNIVVNSINGVMSDLSIPDTDAAVNGTHIVLVN